MGKVFAELVLAGLIVALLVWIMAARGPHAHTPPACVQPTAVPATWYGNCPKGAAW